MPIRIRLYQVAVVVLTALMATLFVHWFITQPVTVSPGKRELTFWATMMFSRYIVWDGYAHYFSITLGLMATTALAACALASMLAIRVPEQIATRRLAWALVTASFAAGYIYFVTAHEEYRALIGWTPVSPIRLVCDIFAYSAGFISPLLLARFFLSYPRTMRPETWEAESLRYFQDARKAIESPGNWRRWFYPASLRRRMARPQARSKLLSFTSDEESARKGTRLVGAVQSDKAVLALIAWALLCATVDWLDARQAIAAGAHSSFLPIVKVFASLFWFLMPLFTWEVASKSLRIYAHSASPDDRRKVDWIKSTLLVGGILVICVQIGGAGAMTLLVSWLEKKGIFLPPQVFVFGPVFISVQLLALAFIVALALSIFYRGAIDPRLAARKITLFGVLGLVIAFLFIFIERTVALNIVAFFNLPPDTGALLAGAAVAVSITPVKSRAEKAVNLIVGRFLPLDSMIAGERKTLVVALSDLSGYTLLSSRDEKQALLLAALLQRQAAKLTEAHGGRVVKSMGDAVMFVFDDATSAAQVLTTLHRDFAPAADQVGIQALRVHSGAHLGEVTVAHDGDIYGQTVNIAARIQGAADPGRIVVSEAFALAAEGASYRDMGPQQFRNVPQAISCRELLGPAPLLTQPADG